LSHTVSAILDSFATPLSIIGTDSNAKKPLWNSCGKDSHGRELENLITRHKLNIVNRPHADLDFIPKGTSFVDITLAGDQIVVSRWLYLAFPSLSDHPYIYFEVGFAGMAPPPATPAAARKALALNCITRATFLDNLARSLPNFESHMVSFPSPGSTDLGILSVCCVGFLR
jgi:hypothetical protein